MLANVNISELENKTILELYQIARDINLIGYSKLRKKELVFEITKALTHSDELLQAQGVLEIMPDGYGFLRPFAYLPSQDDIYVSPSQIRKFELRTGDRVAGQVRSPKDNERFFALLKVEDVNGFPPEDSTKRIHFDHYIGVYGG
jgi:transcription termination factor Rho